jgi:hypothetical protein
VPDVEIEGEQEVPGAWTFTARVAGPQGPASHALSLSWADYNLWSGDGSDPPHAVARAVVEFLLARMAGRDLPARIDASLARRRFPDADREIPRLIRRSAG